MSEDIFEVELEDVYHYRLSYGGQSAFFHGLQNKQLVASRCSGCGFVWIPLRPVCSKCYSDAKKIVLSGYGEILTSVPLQSPPDHLKHLKSMIASTLVLPEGADTCLKAFAVVGESGLQKGTRVKAHFLKDVGTIADFYFAPA